jgi:hypothetical protein
MILSAFVDVNPVLFLGEINMNAVSLLREQVQASHDDLQAVMSDVTLEMAHWRPPGNAHPIGSRFMHAIFPIEGYIIAILAGGMPLFAGEWANRTGASEPHPVVEDGKWARKTPYGEPRPMEEDGLFEWARSVQVDLEAAREYARAVNAAADDYIASLTPEDLEKSIDLTNLGLGTMTVAAILTQAVVTHVHDVIGEIACVKGLQGARGFTL